MTQRRLGETEVEYQCRKRYEDNKRREESASDDLLDLAVDVGVGLLVSGLLSSGDSDSFGSSSSSDWSGGGGDSGGGGSSGDW
jgi:uncharacterized membrane protein YgcG